MGNLLDIEGISDNESNFNLRVVSEENFQGNEVDTSGKVCRIGEKINKKVYFKETGIIPDSIYLTFLVKRKILKVKEKMGL